jgi:ArsR family transcriptional regulator, arsenate/arsenite/antimonite-responsive transcriptional repressor
MPRADAPAHGLGYGMPETVAMLKALADPVRWKALTFLRDLGQSTCSDVDRGVCACDLEHVLGVSQPTVSHHMKQLVDVGLVRAMRRSRWVFYEIDADRFGALQAEIGRFASARAPAPGGSERVADRTLG